MYIRPTVPPRRRSSRRCIKKYIIKVTKLKQESMGTKTLKSAVKNGLGTCISAGLTIEGKHPKEVQKEVDEGSWDEDLK